MKGLMRDCHKWLFPIVISSLIGVLAVTGVSYIAQRANMYSLAVIGLAVAVLSFESYLSMKQRVENAKLNQAAEKDMWLKPDPIVKWLDEVSGWLRDAFYMLVTLCIGIFTVLLCVWFYWLLPDWCIHQLIHGLGGLGIVVEPTIPVHIVGLCAWIGTLVLGVCVICSDPFVAERH